MLYIAQTQLNPIYGIIFTQIIQLSVTIEEICSYESTGSKSGHIYAVIM